MQSRGLCLLVLDFDFCLALGLRLAGGESWLSSGGWIFCHLLSIELLSTFCSSLTSGCNIFSVFHSVFFWGIFQYLLELLFCFSLWWWWSCPLSGTQLPVLMCLMCSLGAATSSPTLLPSFTNTEQLKTTFVSCFLLRAALPTCHHSHLTIWHFQRPGCILGLMPTGYE